MIGLPVLAVTGADVLYRTFQLSPQQTMAREVGAADAVVDDTGESAITQEPWPSSSLNVVQSAQPHRNGTVDVAALLPPGTRTVTFWELESTVAVGRSATRATLNDLPYADPLARGIYHPISGQAPTRAGEAALTP